MDAPAHPLTDHIGQIVKLSDEDKSIVLRSFQPSHLKKKEYLLKEGMISHHMRFIKQGCLRSFYLEENAKQQVYEFAFIAASLKLRGASGSPLRPLAIPLRK